MHIPITNRREGADETVSMGKYEKKDENLVYFYMHHDIYGLWAAVRGKGLGL